MATRNYSNVAAPVSLTEAVTSTATTLPVGSTGGFPDAPFLLAIARGTVDEEVCLCTAKGSTSFAVERGFDDTTGRSHDSGVLVEHTVAAIEYREANEHVNNESNPHGTTAVQVGADEVGTADAAVTAHEAESDPHPQYLNESDGYLQESDGDARYTLQVGGTIRGYVEPSDDPGASGTVTLDLSAHNVFDVTPTGTIDFAFSGLPSSGDSASATIIVRNDSHAITWPAGTRFAGGEAPELDGETWLVAVAVGSQVTVLESASAVA